MNLGTLTMNFTRTVFISFIAFIFTALIFSTSSMAASNTATGDVAGNSSALTDSTAITINSTGSQLKLVKRAFLTDGTWLADGATLPQGTPVKFVIYIENNTAVSIPDVNIVDALAGFTYAAGTIKVNNTGALCAVYGTCTQAEEEAIYASVNGEASFLDDGLNGTDAAGYNGSDTVSAGSGTSNQQLDILPNLVWSMMFTVTLD